MVAYHIAMVGRVLQLNNGCVQQHNNGCVLPDTAQQWYNNG